MKIWYDGVDGNRIDLIQIEPDDMRKFVWSHDIFGIPMWWAIVDSQLLMWPKPEMGFEAHISWP